TQESRDALCAPQDPPSIRAHAPTRALRCARRVPPRGHCAEPEDAGKAHLAAEASRNDGLSCMRVVVSTRHPRDTTAKATDATTREWVKKTNVVPKMLKWQAEPQHRGLFQHYRSKPEVSTRISDFRSSLNNGHH